MNSQRFSPNFTSSAVPVNASASNRIETPLGNTEVAKQNNDPIIVNSEHLKDGNLSLSQQHSNIIRLVQQNPTSPINWQEKGITLSTAINCLKSTSGFNSDMKNVVLEFIEKSTNDTTKIDTLEKGLAFLETEQKLRILVNKIKRHKIC